MVLIEISGQKELETIETQNPVTKDWVYVKNGGTDGNRTRDLLRDRQAF